MAAQKSRDFIEAAKLAGWNSSVEELDAEETRVTVTKGTESIQISWFGPNEACRKPAVYRNSAVVANGEPWERTLRNAAAAYRKLLEEPISPKTTTGRPRNGKKRRAVAVEEIRPEEPKPDFETKEDEEEYQPPRTFGEDLLELPAEEITKMVRGKTVWWTNSITKQPDCAPVMAAPDQRQLKVETNPRNQKPILTWAAADGGFRSVYIEKINQLT